MQRTPSEELPFVEPVGEPVTDPGVPFEPCPSKTPFSDPDPPSPSLPPEYPQEESQACV